MLKQEKGNANVLLFVIIAIIIIVILGVCAFFMLNSNNNTSNSTDNSSSKSLFSKNIKDEVVTAENYESIAERIGSEINNEDEAYQFLYASMYYVMQDGMSSAFDLESTEEEKEANTYARVYGKTVNQLIQEGKQLMKDNNITVDEWKQSMKDFANSVND